MAFKFVRIFRNRLFSLNFPRYKSSAQKNAKKKKTASNTERALKYFDDFYQPVYKEKWPSIRLGLLSPHRYCAVLNNFSNLDENVEIMHEIGAKDVGELYNSELSRLSDKLPTNFEGKVENGNEISVSEKVKEVTEENDKNSNNFDNFNNFTDLNDHVPVTRLKGLENIIDETDYMKHYQPNAENPFPKEILPPLTFPPHLKIYIKEKGNFSPFPPPRRNVLNLFGYYLMDPSSLIPALLLQIEPNDLILDLCSAPGGKALTLIQSMTFKNIVCNDLNRSERLKTVLKSYISGYEKLGIYISNLNAANWEEKDSYNKILVDVPCTNDKLSLTENDNNIFGHSRIKERIELPEVQIEMLVSALKAVKKNGVVVYSTCSLSPIQNEGVVHMALSKIYGESEMEFVVSDLKSAMEMWKFLFKFHEDCRYGSLIIPYLPLNCGPLYFCRIKRTK